MNGFDLDSEGATVYFDGVCREAVKIFPKLEQRFLIPDSFWKPSDMERAVEQGIVPVVKKIFDIFPKCIRKPQLQKSFLERAITTNDIELLNVLLRNFSYNFLCLANGNYFLGLAVREGSPKVLARVIELGNFNAVELNSAICEATELQNFSAVRLLLAHPAANPSFNGNLALSHAIETGSTEILKVLLAHPRTDMILSTFVLFIKGPEEKREEITKLLFEAYQKSIESNKN